MTQKIVNVSTYKFVDLDPANLEQWRQDIKAECLKLGLRGSILLTPEGINIMLAGTESEIDSFKQYMSQYEPFADLNYKESLSTDKPFNRMLVKLKKEIIPLGIDDIDPKNETGENMPPAVLKQWLDEKRDFTLLDVRNDYEVELGTFDEAMDLDLKNFRTFTDEVKKLTPALKKKPVVMFCTGGVRCEKASVVMMRQGFEEVYQLQGGILKYFEEVGGEHYHGECFVFDKRVGVDPKLQETDTVICYACLHPLTKQEQQDPTYVPAVSCPYCIDANSYSESAGKNADANL